MRSGRIFGGGGAALLDDDGSVVVWELVVLFGSHGHGHLGMRRRRRRWMIMPSQSEKDDGEADDAAACLVLTTNPPAAWSMSVVACSWCDDDLFFFGGNNEAMRALNNGTLHTSLLASSLFAGGIRHLTQQCPCHLFQLFVRDSVPTSIHASIACA